jgi:signal transduction histidine kinase
MEIYSDPDRLRQILFNLVSNAARLTQDSRIDMHVQPTDFQQRPGVAIRISIAGVCLTEVQQQLIFDIFSNTSEPLHPAMGSGTGLSLSHRMVSLLGGQIDLICDPHTGSTFQLLLPADGPQLQPIPIDDQDDSLKVEAIINDR